MQPAGTDVEAGACRILVYGVTGSGKSTLAARLAVITGLAWHSVDDLTWEPGWLPVPDAEQRARIEAICAGPGWILDSAYGSWRDVVLARADLIVALDYPRWFSLQRLLRRTLGRLLSRRSACNGNVETLGKVLSRDSIINWHFASFARKRELIRSWLVDPDLPPVRSLTSARATERWLLELGRQVASAHSAPHD